MAEWRLRSEIFLAISPYKKRVIRHSDRRATSLRFSDAGCRAGSSLEFSRELSSEIPSSPSSLIPASFPRETCFLPAWIAPFSFSQARIVDLCAGHETTRPCSECQRAFSGSDLMRVIRGRPACPEGEIQPVRNATSRRGTETDVDSLLGKQTGCPAQVNARQAPAEQLY
jgi:hypothetical protein